VIVFVTTGLPNHPFRAVTTNRDGSLLMISAKSHSNSLQNLTAIHSDEETHHTSLQKDHNKEILFSKKTRDTLSFHQKHNDFLQSHNDVISIIDCSSVAPRSIMILCIQLFEHSSLCVSATVFANSMHPSLLQPNLGQLPFICPTSGPHSGVSLHQFFGLFSMCPPCEHYAAECKYKYMMHAKYTAIQIILRVSHAARNASHNGMEMTCCVCSGRQLMQ
jgi:hypothetical protein